MQPNSAIPEGSEILRKMFIGGLSLGTTEDTLRTFYRKFGDIIDVIIMRDGATNRSRGFAFVTYKDPSSVDRAQAGRPHVIDGKTVDSKRALLRSDTPKTASGNSGRKIFVGGLKEVHDELSLREYFQQFGNILGVKIPIDKNTGRKRGFAYVEFDDYDCADKAVLHKNHTIKYLSVDVKKSNYKEERAKRLGNQENNQNADQQQQSAAPAGYPPAPYPPPYGYPPAYNNWGAPPTPYSQQPPAAAYPAAQTAAPPAPYTAAQTAPPATYAQPPPTSYSQQPPTTYPTQQPPTYGPPPTWNGWSYGAPPQAAGAATAAPPPAAESWNASSAPPPPQNFGNYDQTYNGGPQKAAKLQTNRQNPYRT